MQYPMIIAILATLCLGTPAAFAQDKKEDQLKAMIEAQRYTFRAQTALPARGRIIQLTTEYDLTITRDSVIAFLPYFGRAFTAPVDPSQGGIQFTSTDFAYQLSKRKRGGWNVEIKPKAETGVQQMFLTITSSGNATLNVTSTNRQPITFNGFVETR